jgi:hypothetical protein
MNTYFFEIVKRAFDRYTWVLVVYCRGRRRVIARSNRDYRSPGKARRAVERLQGAMGKAEIVDNFSSTGDYTFEILEDVLPLPVGSAQDAQDADGQDADGQDADGQAADADADDAAAEDAAAEDARAQERSAVGQPLRTAESGPVPEPGTRTENDWTERHAGERPAPVRRLRRLLGWRRAARQESGGGEATSSAAGRGAEAEPASRPPAGAPS